jgi:hypothetical protein
VVEVDSLEGTDENSLKEKILFLDDSVKVLRRKMVEQEHDIKIEILKSSHYRS